MIGMAGITGKQCTMTFTKAIQGFAPIVHPGLPGSRGQMIRSPRSLIITFRKA